MASSRVSRYLSLAKSFITTKRIIPRISKRAMEKLYLDIFLIIYAFSNVHLTYTLNSSLDNFILTLHMETEHSHPPGQYRSDGLRLGGEGFKNKAFNLCDYTGRTITGAQGLGR